VDKWIGTSGDLALTGIYEKIDEIKKGKNYPIFIHTHPTMTSFSTFDFTRMILNDKLLLMPQGISTKHINFMFIPKEKTFLHGRKRIISYLKEKKNYICYDKEALRILKEEAFLGQDFPNSYKYFWNVYIGATVSAFMGADFYAIPVTKKGEKYCKMMKKGLKALSGLTLKTK
jgi:hypothetical protein